MAVSEIFEIPEWPYTSTSERMLQDLQDSLPLLREKFSLSENFDNQTRKLIH